MSWSKRLARGNEMTREEFDSILAELQAQGPDVFALANAREQATGCSDLNYVLSRGLNEGWIEEPAE